MDATFLKHKRIATIAIVSILSVMLILSVTAASKSSSIEVAGLGRYYAYVP